MGNKNNQPRKVSISRQRFFCLEEMPNYYPMMAGVAWNTARANRFFRSRGLKKGFSCLVTTYQDNVCQLLVAHQEFKALGLEILARIKKDKGWGEKYFRDLKQAEDKLYQASHNLKKINLVKRSDRELFKIYEDYYRIYSQLHIFHWIQTAADFGENIFSRYLMDYLKNKISAKRYTLGDVFSTLTTPTEEAKSAGEYQELLLVLERIIREPALKKYFSQNSAEEIESALPKLNKNLNSVISRHAEDFGWLGYNTIGPAWGREYFLDILSSLIRQEADPKKILQEIKNNRTQIFKKRTRLIKDLKIDKKHESMFIFARNLVLTKGTRKDSMFHSYSIIERLFKAISHRHYLSLRQVRYLYPHEFKKILFGRGFDVSILNERYKFNLYYSVGNYEDDLIMSGPGAKKIYSRLNVIKENTKNIRLLSGDCAFPGKIKGVIKIINITGDIPKMQKGNILVSIATTPDLVPAMKKAAAIITDAGGITCHAAIVSRELRIPCVVGTKIATKVLHDGDLVEVDAGKGVVRLLKKEKRS